MDNAKPQLRLKSILALLLSLGLAFASMTAYGGDIVTYVITDINGNPVAKTDSSGAVIWRQSYTPYGETNQQPDLDGPGYTGHRHDAATGLVYMQARYYDPKIARFLSPDPVTFSPGQPQNFNRYWYARGNPYKYVDPDGRNVTTFLAGVLYESAQAITGNGFDSSHLAGALTDGYNGEGSGVLSSALQDAATLAPAAGRVVAKVVKATVSAVKGARAAKAARANKIHHIFSRPGHNLGGVVKNLGGEKRAFGAIEKATTKAVDTSKSGRFETTVKVGGEQVTVRGSVVDGQVKVGTAFVKDKP